MGDPFSQLVFTRTAYRQRLRYAIAGNALAVVLVVLSGCSVGDRLGPNRLDADGYTPLMRAASPCPFSAAARKAVPPAFPRTITPAFINSCSRVM